MIRFANCRLAAASLLAAARCLALLPPEPAAAAPPAPAQIQADLERVLGFLDSAMPKRTTDLGQPGMFDPLAYETGVVHLGMLSAAEATGDRRFATFTVRRLELMAALGNTFSSVRAPASLDDCGSMLAALLQARREGVGPGLAPLIERWSHFIAKDQFRLPDGTFARHRPQPVSVWVDDMYMSIPALAQMGRMTGDSAWWDDGVRNVRGFSGRLFRPSVGLYAHGWHEDNPAAPDFFWGRGNGWAVLAVESLLDELPADYPGRADCLGLLQAHLRGVAALQSGEGLWHQMLNRENSYLETSGSAMFVYGLAHAINRGWISPAVYGSIAQVGWEAVARQINAQGQVENTCVGTTMGATEAFYDHRPVSVYALHSYGPVLLAGAEMIRLVRNPAISIVEKNNLWQFVPVKTGP